MVADRLGNGVGGRFARALVLPSLNDIGPVNLQRLKLLWERRQRPPGIFRAVKRLWRSSSKALRSSSPCLRSRLSTALAARAALE
jgi:hypothetical protein